VVRAVVLEVLKMVVVVHFHLEDFIVLVALVEVLLPEELAVTEVKERLEVVVEEEVLELQVVQEEMVDLVW
jgi:hypothetical protein